MENSSIEFMSMNISGALSCVGVVTWRAPDELYLTSLSGHFSTKAPRFTTRKIELELEFDTLQRSGDLPHLTIAVTPADK